MQAPLHSLHHCILATRYFPSIGKMISIYEELHRNFRHALNSLKYSQQKVMLRPGFELGSFIPNLLTLCAPPPTPQYREPVALSNLNKLKHTYSLNSSLHLVNLLIDLSNILLIVFFRFKPGRKRTITALPAVRA